LVVDGTHRWTGAGDAGLSRALIVIKSAGGRGEVIPLQGALSTFESAGEEIVRLRRPSDPLIPFFDYRGMPDSFPGFVYSSDDAPPVKDDFGGTFFAN
jgi:hypothetical protein